MTPAHHNLFKWWPWSDLDLFYGKVKFGNLGFFYWKKWKLLIFRTFAACDLKPTEKNEHMWVLKVKVISWPWPKVIYIQNLNLLFSETTGPIKPNFICKLSGTRKWKFIDMMLVTWPRWPPRPYMVKTLQKSSSPEPAGRFSRNLVCSIRDSSPS